MRTGLRLVSDHHGAHSGEKGRPAAKPGNGAKRKTTILVVDDDVLIRLSIGEYLRECDYRVLEASNAVEAKAILESREPVELVFSDINMPGNMNGFELAQWIRVQYPDIRVLLTSGVNQLANNTGYGSEEGPLVQKPYTFDVVLAYIKRLLLS